MKNIFIKYKLIILGLFFWYGLPFLLNFIHFKQFVELKMLILGLSLISSWLGFILFVLGIIKLFKKKNNINIDTNSLKIDHSSIVKSQISEIFGMTIYILLGISLIIFSPLISTILSNLIKNIGVSLIMIFMVFIPLILIGGGFFIFLGMKKLNRYLKLRKQINNN